MEREGGRTLEGRRQNISLLQSPIFPSSPRAAGSHFASPFFPLQFRFRDRRTALIL